MVFKVLKKFFYILSFIVLNIANFFAKLGLCAINLIILSPLILLQVIFSSTLVIWFLGEITAFVTMRKFVWMSYFDMSQYPIDVQQAFQLEKNESVINNLNIYTLPLLVVLFLVLCMSLYLWLSPKK